jgi:alpha-methylacyl-CoA racemase
VLAAKFRTRTRDEWSTLLETSDACVSPVLSFAEAPRHAHLKARGTFVEIDGIVQAAPAPRFSRSVPDLPTPPRAITPANTDAALSDWFEPARIAALRDAGLIE